MGNTAAREPVVLAASTAATPTTPTTTTATGEKPKTCKACCACPETKRVRDQCIVENGQENCAPLIEAHLKCMRDQGFNI